MKKIKFILSMYMNRIKSRYVYEKFEIQDMNMNRMKPSIYMKIIMKLD